MVEPSEMQPVTGCRSCGAISLQTLIEFGEVPLADRLRSSHELAQVEKRFPLSLMFCSECGLVQLRETVNPALLFAEDYPYYSAYSQSWVEHCRANAEELIATRALNAESLVVEIASNDGYLLKNFVGQGIPTLGIDPVPGPAAVAEKQGIRTCREFFGHDLALELRKRGELADLIIANNVLAHVRDLRGFVGGIREILKQDGVAVLEFPYLRDLIERCSFDTIYHEHLCYFSLTALDRLFLEQGLLIQDVRRLPTHGGSLRLYVQHAGRCHRTANVRSLFNEEREIGLTSAECFEPFRDVVNRVCHNLKNELIRLKSLGQRIAAYGAAAKGAMLLNLCGIDEQLIEYVVDKNDHKQGLYMPGVAIPIHAPEHLKVVPPDCLLLLPWNLQNEIMQQEAEYLESGGKILIPIPDCHYLDVRRKAG